MSKPTLLVVSALCVACVACGGDRNVELRIANRSGRAVTIGALFRYHDEGGEEHDANPVKGDQMKDGEVLNIPSAVSLPTANDVTLHASAVWTESIVIPEVDSVVIPAGATDVSCSVWFGEGSTRPTVATECHPLAR